MEKEKKNRTISASVTVISMAVLLLSLFFLRLKSETPPPPPKKAILIELSSVGGGGGGGYEQPTTTKTSARDAKNTATQNATDAPSVRRGTATQEAAPKTPTLNERAVFRGGRGGGAGGGEGTGTGSGRGSGFGPGEGSGSGGGIGYGTGTRGYTHMPNLEVYEDGTVYVEVHVTADGNVIGAKVLYGNKYPTTITNKEILESCIAKAKTAKYKPGKEEFRVIVFK